MADKLTPRERDKKQRAKADRRTLKILQQAWASLVADGIDRLRSISPDTWKKAQEQDDLEVLEDDSAAQLALAVEHASQYTGQPYTQARDWKAQIADMTRVQRMVHLAMRFAFDEIEQLRVTLLRNMRRSYEDELTIQAGRVGCPNRQGMLRNGAILTEINVLAGERSGQIANTYNYDLAIAIKVIAAKNPRANRHHYARHLATWEQARASWKLPQVNTHQAGEARAKAQQDFYRQNSALIGYAILVPRTAVCPICKGWIKRGRVPMRIALAEPPPYHVNCPHLWETHPQKARDCDALWMGE